MKQYLFLAALATVFVSSILIIILFNTPNPQQKNPVTVKPTPTEVEWKTYKNDQYNFEFKYQGDLLFSPLIIKKSDKITAFDYLFQNRPDKLTYDGSVPVAILSKVDGFTSYSWQFDPYGAKTVLVDHNDFFIELFPSQSHEKNNIQLNQILSTFKFTQ